MPVRAKVSSIFHSSVCWMDEAEAGVYSQLNACSHGEMQQLIETNKSFVLDSLVQESKRHVVTMSITAFHFDVRLQLQDRVMP